MPTTLTAEQILALAPDAASAKAGQGLASARKWLLLGHNPQAAWGECQGSGSQPYRTQIDLGEPAFRCSCPSRKFPCKHGLGLLLLLAAQPAEFGSSDPPPWVAEWLAQRAGRASTAAPAPTAAVAPEKRRAAQAKTAAAREAKVAAGVAELERWLRDQVRQGLASAQGRPTSAWEATAARMIDAQAPGLARLVRELATVAASGAGWQDVLLERLARLHLLLAGYRRLASLPAATQHDIRSTIGFAYNQDELLATAGQRDTWLVLGQHHAEEEHLRVQRTWLWGETSSQPALLLAFAAGNQPLDRSLVPGTALDAELVFFPGAVPLRALIKARHAAPAQPTALPGAATIQQATASYASALAANPWIERFPLALAAVVPQYIPANNGSAAHWLVRDTDGRALPLRLADSHGWRLLALSGGEPLALFGEWDGQVLTVLAAGGAGALQFF